MRHIVASQYGHATGFLVDLLQGSMQIRQSGIVANQKEGSSEKENNTLKGLLGLKPINFLPWVSRSLDLRP